MLDLDDTTVPHGKSSVPSERVTQAIGRAKNRIHICVATARTLVDTMPILSHLDLSGPCILTNGTQIYDPVTKEIVYEKLLPRESLSDIFEAAKKNKLRAIQYNGVEDVEYTGDNIQEKILSVYFPEVDRLMIDSIVTEFKKIPNITVQKLNAWNKRYMSIDVTDREASKLHGIVEIARILGIETKDIIGVGDGYNDFPLLMACGLKIAMGNAVPELKAIADFIAPTVYEDGVAIVLEKFVLTD